MLALIIFAALASAFALWGGMNVGGKAPMFNTPDAILAIDAAYSAAANGLEA